MSLELRCHLENIEKENVRLRNFTFLIDAYKNIDRESPSCLLMCNPENERYLKRHKFPSLIMSINHIRVKKPSEGRFRDVVLRIKSSPFTLVDSNNRSISVTPTSDTELYFTKIQRDNNIDIIKKILYVNNVLSNDRELTIGVESFKNLLFEGDVVTIGGLLYYNFSSDSLEIKDIDIITGGGQQNMIQYFKEWKRFHSTIFAL